MRYDDDDPYLVVAADKGTATFSDIANEVVGRSTASGSATPSPPAAPTAMTTRRWASPPAAPGNRSSATSASSACDVQTEDFTVVAIGDMSGDVFGNGMLLLAAHPPAGGVQPRPRLPRPRSGPGGELRRAPAAVRAAALVLDRLRPGADLGRRRRARSRPEVDPDHPGGQGGARDRGRPAVADRADPPTAAGDRGPALQRRHRHLRQGRRRDPPRGRRPRQRRGARRRRPAALPGRRGGRQPRLHPARADRVRPAAAVPTAPAGGSTTTPSTTSPGSTAPTTRSTSRSCSASSSPRAR